MRSILLASTVTLSLLSGQALAGLTTHRAHGPIHQVVDFSQTSFSQTTSTSFVDLPSASFNLIVPSGADQLVMARFTAEASIYGPNVSSDWCAVRIMAGNTEMTPNSGQDFAFANAVIPNTSNWVGATMDRSMVLHPGTYVIKVQYETTDTVDTCALDDWHLNVMTADNGP